MKRDLFSLIMLLFTLTTYGQDTIFVKSGEIIPANIISSDNTEITYKKFGQPEPAAVYSVFVSDIKSVHFKDGIIADYSTPGNTTKRPRKPVEMANTLGIGRITIGMNAEYFKRNSSDDLLEFWQKNASLNNNTPIEGNPVSYPFNIRMSFVLDQAKRNWLGTGLQLIFTAQDAIHAESTDGKDNIRLKSWYYNIPLYYGHAINHKKTVIAIFEPALDLSFTSGNIKINNVDHKVTMNLGVGMNIGMGLDWLISNRVVANVRVGQKFAKVKESHESQISDTGYQTFYINYPLKDDLLTYRLNGPYVSAGISWAMYFKMKGFREE